MTVNADIARALAIAALACGIVVGSLFLWIGVPITGMWLAGELTTTSEGFLFATLGGIPLAMIVTGWVLYRINSVYVRLRGGPPERRGGRSAWLGSSSDTRMRRAPRGLIDIAMTVSAVTAMTLILVWFFFFATTDLAPMQ